MRDKMQVEDEFLTEMQFYADIQAQELTQALQQKEHAERQKEEERRQREEAERQKESAIQLLLEMGLPKDEIAHKLGLSEGEIERY